jgi:hypothetical protein
MTPQALARHWRNGAARADSLTFARRIPNGAKLSGKAQRIAAAEKALALQSSEALLAALQGGALFIAKPGRLCTPP